MTTSAPVVANSYMLPQGARPAARPRATTAPRWSSEGEPGQRDGDAARRCDARARGRGRRVVRRLPCPAAARGARTGHRPSRERGTCGAGTCRTAAPATGEVERERAERPGVHGHGGVHEQVADPGQRILRRHAHSSPCSRSASCSASCSACRPASCPSSCRPSGARPPRAATAPRRPAAGRPRGRAPRPRPRYGRAAPVLALNQTRRRRTNREARQAGQRQDRGARAPTASSGRTGRRTPRSGAPLERDGAGAARQRARSHPARGEAAAADRRRP